MRRMIVAALLLVAVPLSASRAIAENPSTKIKGYMFGDSYWMAANHSEAIEDQNGFWFRRIYLTIDHTMNEELSSRLRLEMASPGDFSSSTTMDAFVKDAWVKWKRKGQSVIFGLSPTPTFQVVEEMWGYRSVEKTPQDLQKWASSRDIGLSVKGAFDESRRLRYHVMLGNGSSTKGETNEGKKVMAALSVHPDEHFVIEAYADYENRPGNADRTTYQGFAGYRHERARAGVLYTHQKREDPSGGCDLDLDLVSGFAVMKLADDVDALARIDHTFDANPDAAKISYLPFAPDAEATFFVVGVDLEANPQLHIIPNVEVVVYSGENGAADPDSDVMGRITLFAKF